MTEPIKSLADYKRLMTVGTEADCINHVYPELSGRRRVLRVQTNRICLSLPVEHPRYAATPNGSSLDMPKAKDCTFNPDGSVTIARPAEWGDTGPFVTIHLVEGDKQ